MIAHDYLSNIEENFIALFEFETAAKLRDQIKELQA